MHPVPAVAAPTPTPSGRLPPGRRAAVRASGGMVASSHPAVSRSGADVLADGGTAVDAALAMAATSWVALPGQCGIGGDAFALVREPGGAVRAYCGSGYGPDGATPDRHVGLATLPRYGAAAVAAPGAVAALAGLHAGGGTRPLTTLWAPAVRAAREGLACTPRTRADITAHAGRLAADPDVAAALLPGGALLAEGAALRHPMLATTIERLAADPAALYTGGLAARAVEHLAALGAPFSGDEWAATGQVRAEPALRRRYRGRWVYPTPMPTPGWMVLDQLAVCEDELAHRAPLDTGAVHWLAGAARIAFADRCTHAGTDSDGWRRGGSDEAVARARTRIRANALPGPVGARPSGDTTSMVAVDAEGRAVSFIHSLAFTFGSGLAVPGTGIVLNNRLGRGAYLYPGHPNELRPRRRPLHTLNAWVVTGDEGELVAVGNTPGGDGQVQWNTQVLSHLLDHGADPQDAVDAPRFSVFPGSDAEDLGAPGELRCEERLGAAVLDGLRALGHPVVTLGGWDGGGSAQVIARDPGGDLLGGSDSRNGGVALDA